MPLPSFAGRKERDQNRSHLGHKEKRGQKLLGGLFSQSPTDDGGRARGGHQKNEAAVMRPSLLSISRPLDLGFSILPVKFMSDLLFLGHLGRL